MTQFAFLRTVPRALCASAIALSLVVPLTGCGGGLGRPFGGGVSALPSRKVGEIAVTVQWPERTRLIPDATNSIVVNIRDSAGNNAPGFPKTLVRPTDVVGSSPTTVATTTASNLQVGLPGSPENYTITASAFPTTTGTGTAQSSGGTTVGLDTDNPTNNGVVFTLGTTIRTVDISITDGSTAAQNLGKDRTRAFVATARDSSGAIVLTTASKWKWEILSSGIGNFLNPDRTSAGATFFGNGATYIAGDPGSASTSVSIKVTETESSDSDSANPGRYTTTTTVNIVPLGLSTSAWPRFRGSKQNLGRGTAGTSIASSVSQVWGGPLNIAPRNVVFSSTVVDQNGVLYIGGYDEATGRSGRLFAINPDGTLKWSYTAKGRIESSPVISKDGTIYFGSFDDASNGGFIYALKSNAAGTAPQEVWVKQTAGPVYGTPALDANGFLYYGTTGSDRKLYKADSLNGIPVTGWTVQANTDIQTSPALSDDESTVYFTSAGDTDSSGNRIGARLHAVNTATAATVWVFDTVDQSVTMSSPVVSGGNIYFGTLEGNFFAVSQTAGTLAWTTTFDAEAQIYSTPAVSSDGTRVFFSTFDNISGVDKNRVIALNTADGSLAWETPTFTAGFTSSPALSADGTRLYVGCYDGNVYGINSTSGAVAWQFATGTTDENFDSSPCVGPSGNVYIGSFKGNVYALH